MTIDSMLTLAIAVLEAIKNCNKEYALSFTTGNPGIYPELPFKGVLELDSGLLVFGEWLQFCD